MLDHWEDFGPPVYISAAAYLGLTKKRSSSTPDQDDKTENVERSDDEKKYGNLNELAAMFSGSGGVIQ